MALKRAKSLQVVSRLLPRLAVAFERNLEVLHQPFGSDMLSKLNDLCRLIPNDHDPIFTTTTVEQRIMGMSTLESS